MSTQNSQSDNVSGGVGKLVARDAKIVTAVRAATTEMDAGGRPFLKEASAIDIEQSLISIAAFCGSDGLAHAIVRKSRLLHSCMGKRWTHPPTRRTMISAVVSALKYDAQLGTPATMTYWRARLKEAVVVADELAKDNTLTEREAASMPTYDELNKALRIASADAHSMLGSSQEYLWLLISVNVPPKRADWGQLLLVKNVSRVPPSTNALILPPSGPASLCLQVYKTDKYYHRYVEELPESVTVAIRDSLFIHPRAYLFVDRSGGCFKTRDAWRQWVQRKLTKLLGCKATVNGLRKMWVQTYANPARTTIRQQEEIAKTMLHSAHSQRTHYMHKIPDDM